ncbi:hypothetical protein Syun_001490 [Stephania yunnanensis]|uniref:Uncharacterized protein n=1 Tax=Stephania yunnanensis TaxID=152371 RepID=A0AAP0LGS0_9MAGN
MHKEGVCLGFCNQEALKSSQAYQETDAFKNRSEKASKNMRIENERPETSVSIHSGGSTSFETHNKRLEIKFGRPTKVNDLYLHTHTKKHDGKTFTDARSVDVHLSIQYIFRLF